MFSNSSLRRAVCGLVAGMVLFVMTWDVQGGVVISQIYGAGGNAGAPYSNDYIEIYNSGPASQNLAGWSVQYASATGSSWQVTSLPNVVLPAGRYLLIGEAAGSSWTAGQAAALPTSDVLPAGTIPMSATDGKVALCSSIVPLTSATPSGGSVVDLVGFGSATWNEPGNSDFENNAPSPSVDAAIFRIGCGGLDTNNNAQNFVRGFPSPKNSNSNLDTLGITGIGYATPNIAEATGSTLLVATPSTCGGTALPNGTVVFVDLTTIGGSPNQVLNDSGTNGDQRSGDGIYSRTVTISAGTTAGTKSLPGFVTDNENVYGGFYISVVVNPSSAPNNDNCATAIPIVGPYLAPVDASGTFTGATVEYNPIFAEPTSPSPPFFGTSGDINMSGGTGGKRGLWYSVVGSGNTLTASLCGGAALDSIMQVFGGTCDGLTVVATGNNDGPACGGTNASTSWCTTAGTTYYIWISPLAGGASTSAFTLRIIDNSTPCSTAVDCSTCTLTPGASPTREVEAGFGPEFNGGCDMPANQNFFTTLSSVGYPGKNIAGSARGYGDGRDTDWYKFQAATTDTLVASVTAQHAVVVSIHQLSGSGTCPATQLAASGVSTRCQPVSASVAATAGNWYAVRVTHSPTSTTGGAAVGATSNNYIGTITLGSPPVNDNCATPATIAASGNGPGGVNGNNAVATLDGASNGCSVAVDKDLWYSFQPNASGWWDIGTCNVTTQDTVVEVYDACGGLVVGCNDDTVGCGSGGTQSKVIVSLQSSTTYRVRVASKGFPATGGAFNLLVAPSTVGACCLLENTCQVIPASICANLGGLYQGDGSTCADTDGDLIADLCDACPLDADNDVDGDTVCGDVDNCPDDANTDQLDGDTDNVGDVCDNCPTDVNTDQANADGDSAGDACELCDNDANKLAPGVCGCGVADVDTDGDLTLDCNDGCPNDPNKLAPGVCGCGVPDTDTDGDLTPDCNDGCPNDPNKTAPGACGCGVPDIDADGDLTPDCNDGCPNDPNKIAPGLCGCGVADVDTDGDLTLDCNDGCPLDANKIAPGVCGCGAADVDTDGDLTLDCNDGCPLDANKIAPGVCGCGVADADTDGDLTLDCNDGCPNDPNKVAPGPCGCGVAEVHSDGDSRPDCIDNCDSVANENQLDSDGDSVGDACDNCPFVSNPLQEDNNGTDDGAGAGDACELQICPTCPNNTLVLIPQNIMRVNPDSCLSAGEDTIVLEIWMANVQAPGATGWQAFLSFNDSLLDFEAGDVDTAYTSTPFDAHIQPIATSYFGGLIHLDGNKSPVMGNPPSGETGDALLATLVFSVDDLGWQCAETPVAFESNGPFNSELSHLGTPIGTFAGDIDVSRDTEPSEITVNVTPLVDPDPSDCSYPVQISGSVSDNCCLSAAAVSISFGLVNEAIGDIDTTAITPVQDDPTTVSFSATRIVSGLLDCPVTVTATVTAQDCCGNVAVLADSADVNDTTDPVFGALPAAEITVECDEIPAPATVTATDNCDAVVSVGLVTSGNVLDSGPDCPQHYTFTRTWTATDECGNDVSFVQTVHVNDVTDPVFGTLPPAVITVECDADMTPPVVTATDNCDGDVTVGLVVGASVPDSDPACAPHYTFTRTWTATDDCGNDVVFVQTVHVVDTTAPEFTNCPADATAECTPSAPPVVTATDNCDLDVTVGLVTGAPVPAAGPTCPQHYTITRTWTATDDCGNSDTCVQVITVQDTTAPSIVCNDGEVDVGDDIVVNAFAGLCTAVVGVPAPTVGDVCDPAPAVTFAREDGAGSLSDPFSSSFAGVHGIGVTEIVWTATDACGNSANCAQTVTVNAVNEVVNLSIELQGVNSPVSRCVRFIGTPGACQGTDGFATLSFVDHDGDDANHNGLVDATEPALIAATRVRAVVPSVSNPNPVLVACGVYTGLCIKDEQRSLIVSTAIADGGTQYAGGGVVTLMGGDTDNDSDVDINDVTFFLARFGTPDPSYACGSYDVETHRGADFSGNGNVGAEDYTFLSDNWFLTSSCTCSIPFIIQPGDNPLPEDNVVVPQLQFVGKRSLLVSEMAPAVAEKVDLNRDGRFDYLDVERFENERGYSNALSTKLRGGAIPSPSPAVVPAVRAESAEKPAKKKPADGGRVQP